MLTTIGEFAAEFLGIVCDANLAKTWRERRYRGLCLKNSLKGGSWPIFAAKFSILVTVSAHLAQSPHHRSSCLQWAWPSSSSCGPFQITWQTCIPLAHFVAGSGAWWIQSWGQDLHTWLHLGRWHLLRNCHTRSSSLWCFLHCRGFLSTKSLFLLFDLLTWERSWRLHWWHHQLQGARILTHQNSGHWCCWYWCRATCREFCFGPKALYWYSSGKTLPRWNSPMWWTCLWEGVNCNVWPLLKGWLWMRVCISCVDHLCLPYWILWWSQNNNYCLA